MQRTQREIAPSGPRARRLWLDFGGARRVAHEPLGTLEMWPASPSQATPWTVRWSREPSCHASFPDSFEAQAHGADEFIAHARELHARLHLFPAGGAVGFLAYDWARSLEPRAFLSPLPEIHRSWPVARLTFCRQLQSSAHEQATSGESTPWSAFAAPDMLGSYAQQVERVREYIASGDIYQANLTRAFSLPLRNEPSEIYRRLRQSHSMPFGALLEWDDGAVVSNSPERFVRVKGRELLAQPIKGTARREADTQRDIEARESLRCSEKDRAENVMIVDLLRNDLGRVCEWGSVRVPSLWQVESFPTLHHLVSSVEGRLREGLDGWDVLRALFPCGSITGAPKIRAMQVIDELEEAPRGVAMGALGFWEAGGDMDWNVAIRTLTCREGRAFFSVGGGIVWDSDAESEWREMHLKARALQHVLAQA